VKPLRSFGAGPGLMWAATSAFLIWIAACAAAITTGARAAAGTSVMMDLVRERFPLLVAIVLISLPLGLAAGCIRRPAGNGGARFSVARAVCGGGFAGIAGGWAFGKWMEQAGFFPLVAGLVRSDSAMVGVALHFAIAVIIGATFGLLFQREIRGLGSSLAWGAAYGIVWWFVGALTLLPLISGRVPDWTYAHAASLFGSLVGHIVYGLIVGLFYAVVDGAWTWLFERSDPLNREIEGSGVSALSALVRGAAASVIGGLLFSIVMLMTGTLPRVARIVGGTSLGLGFVVHLIIAALIGATYGLLFHHEATDDRAAVAWGTLYGLIWWFLGPLTLFPILLGGTFTWTAAAASAQLPSLIGHMIYGISLALAFRALEHRHLQELFVDERLKRRWQHRRRPAGTSAPAVWLFFIGMSVVLPIVLG
jgi:uncharacterized membrane protein YagU involved in acid resistance